MIMIAAIIIAVAHAFTVLVNLIRLDDYYKLLDDYLLFG